MPHEYRDGVVSPPFLRQFAPLELLEGRMKPCLTSRIVRSGRQSKSGDKGGLALGVSGAQPLKLVEAIGETLRARLSNLGIQLSQLSLVFCGTSLFFETLVDP